MTKRRARDLNLPFPGTPGKYNAITDVPGVLVGFATVVEPRETLKPGEGPIRTGVTAILPRGRRNSLRMIWAGHHNFNGNGELTGTHWINDAGYFTSPICLSNTDAVGVVHDATVKWMIRQYADAFQNDHVWAMPVAAPAFHAAGAAVDPAVATLLLTSTSFVAVNALAIASVVVSLALFLPAARIIRNEEMT